MSRILVVIQARLLSTRLPAKTLLPIAGFPVVVLCALRAGNSGLEVLVAIGDDPSNEALAQVLSRHGIAHRLGSEKDVLGRFVRVTADLAPDDVVVRLTADNLFPDGEFLDALLTTFKRQQVSYLGTHSPLDGLPYGLSAEVFTIAVLRRAQETALSDYDREHVTPWIKKEYGGSFISGSKDLQISDHSHLRCTLDTVDDYLRLQRVFAGVQDPLGISWRRLLEKLAALPDSPKMRVPYKVMHGKVHGVMTLGTAQLGMPYGITNFSGQPSVEESVQIVKEAINYGVTFIDTARAYGEAEARLGRILSPNLKDRVTVITKLDPLQGLEPEASPRCVHYAVDASVYGSLRDLAASRLDVLLLHRWEHRYQFGGEIWNRLLVHRDRGVIGTLGASLYEPAEALQALQDPDIGCLQLPLNLLDWRWRQEPLQKILRQKREVMIFVRSALLQGLLVSEPHHWPEIDRLNSVTWVKKLNVMVQRLGRVNKADLCFAYVRAQPWVTSLVVGLETLAQLRENIRLFNTPQLTEEECRQVEAALGGAPEDLLDPRGWRK